MIVRRVRAFVSRLLGTFGRERLDRELAEELESHVQMHVDDNLRAGMTPAEARRQALIKLGGVEPTKERYRRQRGIPFVETLMQDLRYGLRMLVRKPGFTAVAVATLALGIGANTAVFSLVNATLLRRLPVADPEGLVYVFSGQPNSPYSTASYPDYAELRDRSEVFAGGLAARGGISASLGGGEQTELVVGQIVSGNFFEVLGVRAAVGRTITPADDQTPGAHPVAVISHGLWQKRFGGDRAIVGREIKVNGHAFTIVGVLPAEFRSLEAGRTDDLYVPMMMQAVARPPRGGYSGEMNPDLLGVRGNRWLWLVGRLKEGVTKEQAQGALAPITQQQAELYPDTNRGRIATLTRVADGDPQERGSLLSVAGLLASVVGIVLLIACANVANLMLVRASARRKEIAVRLALGAGRGRLIRQLLTESLLLSVLGGAAGLALGWWAVDLLRAAPPPPGVLPVSLDFSLDGRVLLFTLGVSVVTGLVFGLAPALQASRPDLIPTLKNDSQSPGERRHRRLSLRNALVVTQVALSLVLLVGAGLFVRSLWRAQAIETGFDDERLLTAPLNINLLRYTRAQGREFYRQAVERVEGLPGVESATVARIVPLSGGSSVRGLMIEGRESAGDDFRGEGAGGAGAGLTSVSVSVVGPEYLQTVGVPLLKGRGFEETDREDGPAVVIVNETFAARHFGGEEALGKRLSVNGPQGPWREVVGVARDSKYLTLGEAPTPFAYLPLAQNHETGMTLIVRAQGDPSNLAPAVRQAVGALDPNLPVTNVRPVTEMIGNSLYAARMGATLIGVFGLLALTLAGVGLYGVMSYGVAQRTREIGIRMALGAQGRDVLRLVLREGMLLASLGAVLGLAGAAAASRLLGSFLYGVGTTDAASFVAPAVVLALVALVANLIPARRATRVDPMIALRYE
ncbi:MAG TPA: ABC transporter permease [Pyrinomonadaceae bacterium]|nr:ABC transporter permease [Pyrinomonadaceae bacterium]